MSVLETHRLILRPPRIGDAREVVPILNDPETARMLARTPLPYEYADWEGYIQYLDATPAEPSWAITRKGSRRLIGVLSIILSGGGRGVLGYWASQHHRRQGYMWEAARAVLFHGFEELGVSYVASGYFTDNLASAGLQQKLGFALKGMSEEFCLAIGQSRAHQNTTLTQEAFRAYHPDLWKKS